MKHKASVSNDQEIIRELRDDPQFAAEYLNAAMADSQNPVVLLMALRHLSEARGGLARVAKDAGIERESLYRALSPKGNPRLSTLTAVLRALRMNIRLEPAA
jgi:probable addiction module antidote protein